MTKYQYYRILKPEDSKESTEGIFPIKIGKFPDKVVSFDRDFIQDIYQINESGEASLVSVFWVKPSSWSEMKSFKTTYKNESDQLPGSIFYTVDEDYDII